MIKTDVLKKWIKGTIEYGYVYPNGTWETIAQSNLVTYGGSDIMAKALAGQVNINAMYLVFENAPGAINITEDKTNDAATYQASSANRSFCRVTTIGEPSFSTSGSDYSNNKVTFLAVTDGTSYHVGVPITDSTSVFYHSALIASPDFSDASEDLVFSCSDFSTTITKIAGAQIGVRWTLQIETP